MATSGVTLPGYRPPPKPEDYDTAQAFQSAGGRFSDWTDFDARRRSSQPSPSVPDYSQPYAAAQPSARAATSAAGRAGGVSGLLGFDVDPLGNTQINNQAEQGRVTDRLRAQLAAEAEGRQNRTAADNDQLSRSRELEDRNSALLAIEGAGGRSAPPVSYGSGGGNEQAARSAAFARAKEQAGRIARASLTSIANEVASKNIQGSGLEALKTAGAITSADAPLQELTRDQLMTDLNRASDIGDMTYQGQITQRGQDLGSQPSYLALLRSLY